MSETLFKINIQLFADDDKTEKASPKRKSDAREKGQVLQSKDITGAVLLMVSFFTLKLSANHMYTNIAEFTKKTFVHYTLQEDLLSPASFTVLASEIMILLLTIVGPILGVMLATGLVVSYAQVGFLFTTKTLQPKFEKLNPLEGFKRIFSVHAVMELVKSLFKITAVGYTAYDYIKKEANNMTVLLNMEVMQIASYIGNTAINIALRMGMMLVIIGVIDYIFQWRQHEKGLMMSKQEVKEEYKQSEGNPQIKGKIKEKQREISMRRMMADIPKADVVITNPTHFAVAIRYDANVSAAPLVIAKGQDYIALRIKEIAKEHNIQIVENKPLARSLYATAEIGDEIPADLYQAVAEVLAFVYSLKN